MNKAVVQSNTIGNPNILSEDGTPLNLTDDKRKKRKAL